MKESQEFKGSLDFLEGSLDQSKEEIESPPAIQKFNLMRQINLEQSSVKIEDYETDKSS